MRVFKLVARSAPLVLEVVKENKFLTVQLEPFGEAFTEKVTDQHKNLEGQRLLKIFELPNPDANSEVVVEEATAKKSKK